MADYTIVKVTEVDDVHSGKPGEMRMLRNVINSDQVTLTYRVIPAGYKPAHGHTHSKQDEIIFILSGTLQVRLDDDVVDIEPMTAVRIAPATKRGYHNNGTEDVKMLIISPQGALVGDNGGQPDPDWWPEA